MPPVKAEDLVVHAVKEQFAGLDYCITRGGGRAPRHGVRY
jgi:hypothetical protein